MKLFNTYRPSLQDFFCEGKKLSLKEAGEFDHEHFTAIIKDHDTGQPMRVRVPTTGWTAICQARTNISRRARIRDFGRKGAAI